MSRLTESTHTAFTSMRWATVRHAHYSIASAEVLVALEAAYKLGYSHCRADAAMAVGELLADHETFLEPAAGPRKDIVK